MRSIQDLANPPGKPNDGSTAAGQEDAVDARGAQIARIAAEMAACEKLGDPELALHAGRKLLAVVACATDAARRRRERAAVRAR